MVVHAYDCAFVLVCSNQVCMHAPVHPFYFYGSVCICCHCACLMEMRIMCVCSPPLLLHCSIN